MLGQHDVIVSIACAYHLQLLIDVQLLIDLCLQSDPLGLNAAPAEGGDSNLGNGQRKRRSSEEQGGGPNSFKRAKVKRRPRLDEPERCSAVIG